MSDFKMPTTQYVSDSEYIQNLINVNLQKDLCDDEEICPHCHGTGLIVADNPYGLSNDPNKQIGHFPYKHQAISFCPHCYNGIIHRCKLCGHTLPKGRLKHDCEQQQKLDEIEYAKKQSEEYRKAPIASQEIEEKCDCLYSEEYPYNNGYFSDWDEFFDAWASEHDTDDEKPEYVWITEPVKMHISAQNIVESATDDLYEDAIEHISSEDIHKLQKYLNKWCDTCGVGLTYYESHKYKVKIPWNEM